MELNETPDANGVIREECWACQGTGIRMSRGEHADRTSGVFCNRCRGTRVIERRPLVDARLNTFDAEGVQQVFAISPFGNSETRAERIERLEAMGSIESGCPGCQEFYEHPTLDPFAPRHRSGARCQSGARPHCTCDSCF